MNEIGKYRLKQASIGPGRYFFWIFEQIPIYFGEKKFQNRLYKTTEISHFPKNHSELGGRDRFPIFQKKKATSGLSLRTPKIKMFDVKYIKNGILEP